MSTHHKHHTHSSLHQPSDYPVMNSHLHNPRLDDMFVVTVVSNPVRYKRRYELYERFARMCSLAGVQLVTVEIAFGDRPHLVTARDNPFHLQLRSIEELWHKENMVNLGIAHGRRLLPQAKYVAWVDADCMPGREPRDWFEETWHELQHYKFVQMWEHIMDLDHDYAPLGGSWTGFVANYQKYGTPYPKASQLNPQIKSPYAIQWGSPGLAWAAELSALDAIGGIPDFAILGAGDWYLAHALIGDLHEQDMTAYSPHYRDKLLEMEKRCERWIKRDIGFVRGIVYHWFHGKKANRGYNTRERILMEGQYNPHTDIKYDSQGLLQLETYEPRQIKMRDRVRQYFRARNEDSIDP